MGEGSILCRTANKSINRGWGTSKIVADEEGELGWAGCHHHPAVASAPPGSMDIQPLFPLLFCACGMGIWLWQFLFSWSDRENSVFLPSCLLFFWLARKDWPYLLLSLSSSELMGFFPTPQLEESPFQLEGKNNWSHTFLFSNISFSNNAIMDNTRFKFKSNKEEPAADAINLMSWFSTWSIILNFIVKS